MNTLGVKKDLYPGFSLLTIKKENTPLTLPNDILSYILSILNKKDIQTTLLVNRLWSRLSLDVSKQKHIIRIKSFENFIQKVDPIQEFCFPDSRSPDIKERILVCSNLPEIKIVLSSWQQTTLKKLKHLPLETCNNLISLHQAEKRPKFFEAILYLTRIYERELKVTQQVLPQDLQTSSLNVIYKQLVKVGYIEKIIEIADGLFVDLENLSFCEQNQIFAKIIQFVLANNDIKMAFVIAKHNKLKILEVNILKQIANFIANKDPIDKTFSIVKQFSNSYPINILFFEELANLVLNKGKIDEAIEITQQISDDKCKEEMLKKIIAALLNKMDFDKVVELAKQTSDKCASDIIGEIANLILFIGDGNKAVEVADQIPDKDIKARFLAEIALASRVDITYDLDNQEYDLDNQEYDLVFYKKI